VTRRPTWSAYLEARLTQNFTSFRRQDCAQTAPDTMTCGPKLETQPTELAAALGVGF
jgi:hypothetical protein